MSEWVTRPLGELADFVMGQSPDGSAISEHGPGLPFLQGSAEFGASHPQPAAYVHPPLKVAPADSILISVRAPVGTMNRADQAYGIGRGVAAIVGRERSPRFLRYALELGSRWLERRSQGSTFLAVGSSDLREMPIMTSVPPDACELAAKIVSLIDHQIEQTEALIAKQEQARAGLMQDLFSRGIDKSGRLRPPREEAPELYHETELGWLPKAWRAARIDELATNLDARRIPLKDEDRKHQPGEFPYYGASGVIDHIDDYIFEGDHVLLGEDGANVLTRNSPLAFIASGRFWVNNHAHIFAPLPGVDIQYLELALENKNYAGIVLGSAQPKITQAGLKRLWYALPQSDEQIRVADLATKYTARQRAEQDILGKLRAQRSGLMQSLLTGKVPVDALLKECAA